MPFAFLKPARDAKRIGMPTRCQWRNKKSLQMVIELIRRYNYARPRPSYFSSTSRIERYQIYLSPLRPC
jgi:hypothetical protein